MGFIDSSFWQTVATRDGRGTPTQYATRLLDSRLPNYDRLLRAKQCPWLRNPSPGANYYSVESRTMTKTGVNKLLALLSRIAHAVEVIAKKLSPNFRPERKPEPAGKPDHQDR
jgi:hypothetical protein